MRRARKFGKLKTRKEQNNEEDHQQQKVDTETAECVATWDSDHATTDFAYCSEELYRKKSGEFFLYGEGGAMTRWARSCDGGNSRCGGCGIRPLDEDEAREWVETHANDEYEDIFGDVEE